MKNNPLAARILVTNDDGYNAPGLKALIEIAKSVSDDVWVVAPEEEQSGKGHSLSLSEPVRYRKVADKFYAVKGTPTDCVMMAVHSIMPNRPTILLSGINRGVNLAEDMTYSGTISAAMEGTICGVPSIAFSQEIDRTNNGDAFQVAKEQGENVLRTLISHAIEPGILYNVNFPQDSESLKGIRTTRQGFRDDEELFIDEREDPRGGCYFWIGFRRQYGNPVVGTDLAAIQDGYISVTPLHLDMTHEKTLLSLAKKIDKDA
ncbi:5'/3'-nucleotidase SurE [Paremcibacter congregatus]|uniref:5'-nucleotidase SurE n=1 Tax=Paremcibacter congregatus TaxID=2043170 RepID=A0A2G4YQE5_9PROT|nr:5'/3'-nucleotidase SurE [Paremcibacter congregatus]PHZ83686.1 5'/3'-nucleotidase SurE [Paremcibacter congregatus]QDE27389.1 5'/3'-nucleotidase SurE [Paremcibacter congregatus]